VAFFNPFQQTPGEMQSYLNVRVAKKQVNERTVSFLIRFFDDVIEVADGLMRVDNQCQSDFIQRVTLPERSAVPMQKRSLRPVKLG